MRNDGTNHKTCSRGKGNTSDGAAPTGDEMDASGAYQAEEAAEHVRTRQQILGTKEGRELA